MPRTLSRHLRLCGSPQRLEPAAFNHEGHEEHEGTHEGTPDLRPAPKAWSAAQGGPGQGGCQAHRGPAPKRAPADFTTSLGDADTISPAGFHHEGHEGTRRDTKGHEGTRRDTKGYEEGVSPIRLDFRHFVRERDKESPHQSVPSGQRPEARSADTELAPGCEAAGGQPENEDRGAERRHPFPNAKGTVPGVPGTPPLTPHRTPPAWDGAHAVGETPTGRRRRRRSRYTGSPTQRKTRPIRCGRKADPTHPRRGDRRRV